MRITIQLLTDTEAKYSAPSKAPSSGPKIFLFLSGKWRAVNP